MLIKYVKFYETKQFIIIKKNLLIIIKHNSRLIPKNTLAQFYFANITSHLNYSNLKSKNYMHF